MEWNVLIGYLKRNRKTMSVVLLQQGFYKATVDDVETLYMIYETKS